MTARERRAARALDAASDAGMHDGDVTGLFGILRMVFGPAVNATKRAPQPIRRILWGERPPT